MLSSISKVAALALLVEAASAAAINITDSAIAGSTTTNLFPPTGSTLDTL